MATQPLETIPEEPTPTPTTTPVRVTADPPKTKPATEKNPGRVAAGKRLAAHNRMVREAKKKEAEAEAASAAAQPSDNAPAKSENTTKEESSISLMTMLGIGGLLVSAAGVYYQREAIMARLKPAPQAPALQAATPAPSRIPVKRGIRKMED